MFRTRLRRRIASTYPPLVAFLTGRSGRSKNLGYSDAMTSGRLVACAAVALALTSSAPFAQAPARSLTHVLDTLDRVRSFHETAISL